MTKKEAKRVRTLGKILFILYIIFLVYFLFLSDWYGREGVMDEYHAFMEILGESRDVRAWLADGEKRIQDTFRRPES